MPKQFVTTLYYPAYSDFWTRSCTAPAGDDNLCGAYGNDRLYGFDGNDILHGGYGADRVYGGWNYGDSAGLHP